MSFWRELILKSAWWWTSTNCLLLGHLCKRSLTHCEDVNARHGSYFRWGVIFLIKPTTVTNWRTSHKAASWGTSVGGHGLKSTCFLGWLQSNNHPKKRVDYKCIDGKYYKCVSLKFTLYACLEITRLRRYVVMQETHCKHIEYVKGECTLLAPIRKDTYNKTTVCLIGSL